ncbi:MAG: hypothetical protein AB1420_12185 [Bacillota bacterium]
MTTTITLTLDKILWKWWVGKDSDPQEAFEDLVDTIIVNKDDLDITPWKSSMMEMHTFSVSPDKLKILDNCLKELSMDDFLNGCLKWLRAEEEKLKSAFKVT